MPKNNKILFVNSVNYGSTGTIMLQIANMASNNGCETYITVPAARSNVPKRTNNTIFIGDRIERNIHLKLGYFTGMQGSYSTHGTKKLLKKISQINPDIIHLHNLHNCYINIGLLFDYIKKNNISVVWTLHDCWAFTGQCPHFTMAKCEKWKTECNNCPLYKQYPATMVDKSKEKFYLKRSWFTGVNNMTIVTPSQWLANLVKQSFLKEYPVKVINNGIDLSVFKPTLSRFRNLHGLEDKYIVLGVAFGWGKRKGLDVFIELSKRLDRKYKIVLVGTDDKIDEQLPKNIISIHRTQDQRELAEIYTAADVFVNPTREEVLGLVNVEALACGTPVITFHSGGSPECIDSLCGMVVEKEDVKGIESAVVQICNMKTYSNEACIKRSMHFNKNEKYKEYLQLYDELEKSIKCNSL